jgi:basic membrane protein A
MHYKYGIWLTIMLIVSGAVAACTDPPHSISSSRFKVALLTPGPVSDAGWNAAAFDGLQLIKAKLGAETAMVQTRSPIDFEDGFRDFAARGFNLFSPMATNIRIQQ